MGNISVSVVLCKVSKSEAEATKLAGFPKVRSCYLLAALEQSKQHMLARRHSAVKLFVYLQKSRKTQFSLLQGVYGQRNNQQIHEADS